MQTMERKDTGADRTESRNARARRRTTMSGGRLSLGALAAALAVTFALGAGEAAAQSRVCDNAFSVLPLGTTEERVRELSGLLRQGAIAESPHVSMYCRYGRADRRNRGFLVHNPQIVVVDDFVPGIEAFHEGVGDLGVYVHSVSGQPGSAGDFQHHSPADYGQGIFTTGNAEDYITGEDSYGIHARHTGAGRTGIDVRNVSVRTTGDYSHGVYAWQQGSYILVRSGEDGSDEVVSGYVWNEAEGFFQRGGENCPECRSIRARGAVIVNLIETDRERDQRVRPLVATSGDYADAIRAEYTRAAARGHIAVTVEGYTLATGGTLPLEALVSPQDPRAPLEVASPQDPSTYVFDPSRPSVPNPDYDPDDPRSSRFINVLVHRHPVDDAGNRLEAVDLRPYTAAYLPRLNPDYDPDDPDSPRFISGGNIAIWNGRYFVSQGAIQPEDVTACQGISTAEGRRACYENRVAARSEDNLPTGFDARGIYASHEGHGDIRIRVTDTNIRTGSADDIQTPGADAQGIYATHTGRTIVCGAPGSGCQVGGGTTPGGGGVSIVVTGGAIDTQGEDSHGIWARHRGDSGADEADGAVDPDDVGTGNVAIAVTDADIDTAGAHASGVYGLIQQTCTADTAEGCREAENLVAGTGVGDIDIAVTGGSIDTKGGGGAHAVHARHENTGAITVRLTGVAAATEGHQAHGVFADHAGSAGAVSVTVEGGSVATKGAGAHGVYGSHAGSGDVKVTIASGGTVKAEGFAAQGVRADLAGDGDLTVEVAGVVTTEGDSTELGAGGQGAHGVYGLIQRTCTGTDDEGNCNNYKEGTGVGDIDIRMTAGAVTTKGIEAHGLYAEHTGAAGTVSVSVSGGSVTAVDSSSVGVLARHGADDREGAVTVTVGRGASVTGGLGGIQLIADADADGNIPTRTVNVDGTVRGVSGAGILLPTGGVVNVGATGSVSGGASVGIFSNGDHDADVTVAGAVTGDVLKEGGGALTFTSRAGSTVTGNIRGRGDGALTADVAGAITGDVLNEGDGDLTFISRAGGAVTGNVHSRGAGDLMATISGTVTGDVLGLGSGDHTVTVRQGGTVGGTVRLAASTVAVDGAAGRVWLENGGVVTVGATGEITGIETVREAVLSDAGDLTFTSQAGSTVTGNILIRGAGDLTATLAGAIMGDVLAPGTGTQHRITVAEGGDVTGTVHVATELGRGDPEKSALTVAGAVGRVRADQGGAITVGRKGRIRGIDGIAISAPGRSVDLLIQESPEELSGEAVDRVGGEIDAAERIVSLQPADGSAPSQLGRLGTTEALTRGPYDVGVDENGNPRRVFAPRARVYEALPSVLLGLNGLPTAGERDMAARDSKGAWGQIESARGSWKAERSETGAEYDMRRYGMRAGMEFPVDEAGSRWGFSLHQRGGSAKVSQGGDISQGGEIKVQGFGVGLYGAWHGKDLYVDGQAETTLYEAALDSSLRGRLDGDVSGHGYALGVETGRRMAMGLPGMGEVMVTPRARLVHSSVSVSDFEDLVEQSISLDKGRSMRGRVGVHVETQALGGARLSGTVDVEREFEEARQVTVTRKALPASERATWLHLGLGGVHDSESGRYTLSGKVNYATSGGGDSHEYGGRLNLTVRF